MREAASSPCYHQPASRRKSCSAQPACACRQRTPAAPRAYNGRQRTCSPRWLSIRFRGCLQQPLVAQSLVAGCRPYQNPAAGRICCFSASCVCAWIFIKNSWTCAPLSRQHTSDTVDAHRIMASGWHSSSQQAFHQIGGCCGSAHLEHQRCESA